MSFAFDLRKDLVIYNCSTYNAFKTDLEKLTKYNIDNFYIDAKVKLILLENFEGDHIYNLNIDLTDNNLECIPFSNEIESFLLHGKALDIIMNSNLSLEPLINFKSEQVIKIKIPNKLISKLEESLNPLNKVKNLLLNNDSFVGKILLKDKKEDNVSLDLKSKSYITIFSYVLFGKNVFFKNKINYRALRSLELTDFGIRNLEDVEKLLNMIEIFAKEFEYSKLGKHFLYTNKQFDKEGLLNSIERYKNMLEEIDNILLKYNYKVIRENPRNMFLKKLHKALN